MKAHVEAEPVRRHHHRRGPHRARALEDAELHVLQDDLREADRHQDPAAERRGEAPERQAEQHLRQRRGRVLVRHDVPGRSRSASARTSTTRTGRTPSTTSARSTVMNTDYASLHTGKYDADDTYGLVAFDPTIRPDGDWTPRHPDRRTSAAPANDRTGVSALGSASHAVRGSVRRCCAGWRGRRCRGTTRRRAGRCARRRACPRR